MRLALTPAQTLERLPMAQHLAPLLGQRGALPRDFVLSRHADPQHLRGRLSGWRTTQGRQTQRDAGCILRLAQAMARGHPEERCDRIGADGQADVLEPSGLGGLELLRQRGATLLAHCGRGHLAEQRLTLGQGVVGEPLGFQNALALQEAVGIGPEARDEVLARGQLTHTSP